MKHGFSKFALGWAWYVATEDNVIVEQGYEEDNEVQARHDYEKAVEFWSLHDYDRD